MEENDPSIMTYENLMVDLNGKTVTNQGQLIVLTPLEFKALVYLMNNPARFVSAAELLEKVWDCPGGGTSDQVKSCIKRLRRKLALNDAHDYIQTARGWGYRFGCPPTPKLTPN